MAEARIVRLSEQVADQIAAGEVVERPGSVVKELLENALDAGATRIQVDIDDGGTRRIRVRDNGRGISEDQFVLAFERHATSKIRCLDDLDTVGSYGFRGEALPAIASVSKITARTRTEADVAGHMLRLEGGVVAERQDTGCPVGMDIEVSDLFFNTPARLKFLKRASTEASHVSEALVRLAACRPDISFKMTSQGRKTRDLLKVERLEERVAAMFPGEPLMLAEGKEAGIEVKAILGAPDRARAGAGSLYTYVAGRFIRDKTLLRAVTQAFGGTLDHGHYPIGLIELDPPKGSIDVNVHPQKIEVRFADPQAVYRAVNRVIGEMVARDSWVLGQTEPSVSTEARHGFAPKASAYRPSGRLVPPPPRPQSEVPRIDPPNARIETQPTHRIEPSREQGRFERLDYLGQAQGLFLLFETEDALVIMDQHAAHERITYERLREAVLKGAIPSQRLLVPHAVVMGPQDAEGMMDLQAELNRLGLDISRSGSDRISIHAVPAALTHASPDRLLADMVLALQSGRSDSSGETDEAVLAKMACHGSIRGGRVLSRPEVDALLQQMDQVDFAAHCPHGRPVIVEFPWQEIRRRLGRT
ncbi:MAG: DNA mismatch repair endonuclease MutL [Myxococcota bacterium]|nr:DNA mismatch repair endonuclease MutL [Myxococcota bacterium]